MVDNSSIYTNNYNNYNLFKLKRSCYQRLLRNFLKYSSILKVLKVHYKCCAYHPSNYYKYQFRGGSRTATITKTDYDKELHLGCCSSSRSASAIYMKSSFKKTPWKVSFDLLNIFQRYSNNVCGRGGWWWREEGGRRAARIWSYIIEQWQNLLQLHTN